MKSHFAFIFSVAFTLFSFSAFAVEKTHYVTMTVEQGSTPDRNGRIIVSKGPGVSQEIKLEKATQKGYLTHNTEIITETINKLSTLGFKLMSTSLTPVSTTVQYATYIFYKEL